MENDFVANLKKVLETPRLLLREMTNADFPALSEIIQDKQTMYAYNGAMSDTETREWLERQFLRYKENGFGLWAVILKENGSMIGQCGLSWQNAEGKSVPEIGYLFNRAYWHNGYASEAANACKRYAFEELKFDEVYSIIRENNYPSMNVAIRVGMSVRGRFIKRYRGADMQHLIFSVRRK